MADQLPNRGMKMGPPIRNISRLLFVGIALAGAMVASPSKAMAQWSKTYEQFYMPGSFNWTFRNTYPGADRLFNAFDYGHAILYEKLYTKPDADPSILETNEYNFITQKLLVSPPHVPLEEAAIEVSYAKIAPEAKMMFAWAHMLHRQIYDVLADERMSQQAKDATIQKLIRYYKTRSDLAFSSVPKSMELMEGQPYSLAFRNGYPKFNGLIWGYHWLQIGLYEPMMVGKTLEERQAGVAAAVARFRQMLENAPEHMPRMMPMTAAVSPTFAKRYPEAAIIFDNLHSMHDVVSDILANPIVPHNQKRAEILKAASRYRDPTSFAMTEKEWFDMAQMMGIENMGGPAVGFLLDWATPTIARGQPAAETMKGMQHGGMSTMQGVTNMPGMTRDTSHSMQGMTNMPGMSTDTSRAGQAPPMHNMQGMPLMKDTSKMRNMSNMPSVSAAKNTSTMNGMPAMQGMDHGKMAMPAHATKPKSAARASSSPRKTSAASPRTTSKSSTSTKTVASKATKKKAAPKRPAPVDHSKMKMDMPGMDTSGKKK